MNNEAAVLRLKAEACQRLADLAGTADPIRKALWLTRGDQWTELAAKADKKANKKRRPRSRQSADARERPTPDQEWALLGDAGDEQ